MKTTKTYGSEVAINIGNDRLYQAVCALVSGTGDLRSRVVVAIEICQSLSESDYEKQPGLCEAVNRLRNELSIVRVSEPNPLLSIYARAAKHRQNRTYVKYANEIFRLWMKSCTE